MLSRAASFPEKEPHPSRHLTLLKGYSPQTRAINSAISCLSLICLICAPRGGVGGGGPLSVKPAVSLTVFWLKYRAIKIDLDSNSFFHLSSTHLFALVKCPFKHFTIWLITCCCFQCIVFFYPSLLWSTFHRCHDTHGSQWAHWNLCVVCRVRPVTDRQAHSKLTFHLLTFLPCWLLILLTVHFLCPPPSQINRSLLLSPSSPSLSSSVPLLSRPFLPPPSLLFSFLQQSYSRENYWRWGVWEKQELLPGAGWASHGRHESAERCGTEPFLSVTLSVFSL